jgi:DNA-binding CsgD family transcriptional regulator
VSEDARPSLLSPRQTDCLRLAAAGKTSPEIAKILGISSRTVDQYIAEACERLNVRNRIQAVAKAVSMGLISNGSSVT